MEKVENCISCGVRLIGYGATIFSCPSCGETTMGRCRECRDQSVKYYCSECNFQGP